MRDENLNHVFWGPLATIGWAIVIGLGFLVTQVIVVVVYLMIGQAAQSKKISATLGLLQYDGLLISLSTFATAIAGILMIVLVVKLKRGASLTANLGLVLPSKREFLLWLAVLTIFVILVDLLSLVLGKPIVPEFLSKTYVSLSSPWILWIALLVAAPAFEELFFRGFLIRGLSASGVGWWGAVILSAAGWATTHLQYDFYGMATIFVLGLVFGIARVKTGSTILAIFLHSLTNLVAIVEVIIHIASDATP